MIFGALAVAVLAVPESPANAKMGKEVERGALVSLAAKTQQQAVTQSGHAPNWITNFKP